MQSWLLAWDNLRYNLSKTALAVILISLATTAILVFVGYENYTSEGLRLGFVQQSGAFQISHRSYWLNDTEKPPILNGEDKKIIMEKLDQLQGISSTTEMLAYNGLVGTPNRSTFVAGTAYEVYPDGIYQRVQKESFGRLDETGLVLGVGILSYLQAKEGDAVTMLGQNENGIALGAFNIVGGIDVGDRNANKVVSFTSLDSIRNFYGLVDEFDRIRVDMSDIEAIAGNYAKINELFEGTPYEAKDWLYLNPYFTDIETYNRNNAFWNTVILSLLVITAIVQMLQMSYLQRMRELGTLQAIGLSPKTVYSLLLKETFLIAIISIIVGVICAYLVNVVLKTFGVTFTPPSGTEPYPLILIYNFKDMFVISGGVMLVTILSSLYPTYQATSKPVVEVMKNA